MEARAHGYEPAFACVEARDTQFRDSCFSRGSEGACNYETGFSCVEARGFSPANQGANITRALALVAPDQFRLRETPTNTEIDLPFLPGTA